MFGKDPLVDIIKQYLHENGYESTLAAFDKESGLIFQPDSMEKGSTLSNMYYAHLMDELSKKATSSKTTQSNSLLPSLYLTPTTVPCPSKNSSILEHESNVLICRPHPKLDIIATGTSRNGMNLFQGGKLVTNCNPHSGGVLCVAWHPTIDNILLSAGLDGTVAISQFDINDFSVKPRLLWAQRIHTKFVVAAKWLIDGSGFATASYDHSVHILKVSIDTDSDQPTAVATPFWKETFANSVESIDVSPTHLFIGIRESLCLVILDLQNLKLHYISHADGYEYASQTSSGISILFLSLSSDFSQIALCFDSDCISLFSVQYPDSSALTPSNSDASSTQMQSGSGSVPPAAKPKPKVKEKNPPKIAGNASEFRLFFRKAVFGSKSNEYSRPRCTWDSSGLPYFYCTGEDKSIVIWDLVSGKIVSKISHHKKLVRDLYSHKSKLYSSSFDKTVVIWESKLGTSSET